MTQVRFVDGSRVRVIRNIRNDGTYPGEETGALLLRRGSLGYVRSHGIFLQDQVVYEVHFLDTGRVVGCRQEELIGADEPWVSSRYESREKVTCKHRLAVSGEVVAEPGDVGEIIRVMRELGDEVAYHVRFPGHTLLVPEPTLEPLPDVLQSVDK